MIGHFITYSNFFYPKFKNICKFQIISAAVGVSLGTVGVWPVVARVRSTVARVWPAAAVARMRPVIARV
jgi:hypothetical protein